MYSETSNGVRVTVDPKYLEDESDPGERRFFWSYTVAIENHGDSAVQIVARHWVITDQNGRRQDVRGTGIVGEQPVIQPGERFTYTSGCPLETPSGIMVGSYQARGPDGETISIAIPAFSLDLPDARPILN